MAEVNDGMTNDELPKGWISCSLGEVVEYGKTEKAEPSEFSDKSWILELEDIEKDTSRLLSRITFSQRKSKSTKNRFLLGDVLYGKLRPYLNKIIIADEPGYCTTEIIPLRSNGTLENRYLFYWLKHPTFLSYVTDVSHGLNMPRLGTDAGKAAPFVLAPLAEQKRIADKLELVLGRVDACRARLDRVPALLKRFRQSVLAAATSGKLTEEWRMTNGVNDFEGGNQPEEAPGIPTSWKWVPVGVLATRVTDGVHKKPNYIDSGIPFLTVKSLTAGKGISFEVNNFISEQDHEEFCKRTKPEKGDLLVTKDGTLGVVRMIDTDRVFSIFVSLALIKPKDHRMSPYLLYALQSPVVQKQMVGVGTGLLHIHLRDLRVDVIPLPPLPEQQEIVRRVEALFAFADRIETRLAVARKTIERLTPAVLAKAFRGELVPQDPNDEPASALLACFRSQPAVKPVKAKRSKRP
jgi:type I restriction enzyme S subunit